MKDLIKRYLYATFLSAFILAGIAALIGMSTDNSYTHHKRGHQNYGFERWECRQWLEKAATCSKLKTEIDKYKDNKYYVWYVNELEYIYTLCCRAV